MGASENEPLAALGRLVGEWETEATHPLFPGTVKARATFEWLRGGRFMIWRTDGNPPGTVPNAIAVIGGGDTPGTWPMHYFDERGVFRIYHVEAVGEGWRFWRNEPGFSQRATGSFDADGTVMRLATELDRDGTFEPDLEVTYRRAH